jgi:sulfate transport system permease protein
MVGKDNSRKDPASVNGDSPADRWVLIARPSFLGLFLLLPLLLVFAEAFRKGIQVVESFRSRMPGGHSFDLLARAGRPVQSPRHRGAWAIGRVPFCRQEYLDHLIDLPAVSPVISGLILFCCSAQGWFGSFWHAQSPGSFLPYPGSFSRPSL